MTSSLVFVYGTLRKGGVRAMPALFPGVEDHGFGHVRGTLYDFGAYPGLALDANGASVLGEVYTVDAAMLATLDSIEEYRADDRAGSYYFREAVEAAMQDGSTKTCWAYVFNPGFFSTHERISSGDWIAHAAAKGALPLEAWPDGGQIKNPLRYTLCYGAIELGEVVEGEISLPSLSGVFESVAKTDQPALREHLNAYIRYSVEANRIATESNFGPAFDAILAANEGRFVDLIQDTAWRLVHPSKGSRQILAPHFVANNVMIWRWAFDDEA
jgi:gamma-glutamylcyclotransferase (GGCT)/AIG2-like uncharacterized protein YtfP